MKGEDDAAVQGAAVIACKECGGPFRPKRRNHVYCRPKCNWRAHGAQRTVEPRKCKRCEKDFTPKSGNQRYCLPECREIARVLRGRLIVRPPRCCRGCGELFAPTNNQWYCKDSCRIEAAMLRRPAGRPLERIACIECGRTFMPLHVNQIYCRLPALPPSNVLCIHKEAQRGSTKARPAGKPKPRVCLGCGMKFKSHGPWNRFCSRTACQNRLSGRGDARHAYRRGSDEIIDALMEAEYGAEGLPEAGQ